MRILHIVTLVTPSGAFGGPIRVAENQCRELQNRGHDVVIAGAYDDYAHPPTLVGGVPAQLFRARRVVTRTGFSGLSSPALMRWLRKHVAQFDVVHIHLGRDLVTLPATHIVRRSGVPYVAQPHGMIARSSNRLAGPLDFLMTRRNLQSAKAVYFLTSTERTELAAVAQLRNLRFLPNGVPATTDQPQSPSGKPEVLFLARLHPRKRPDMFVDAAAILLKQGLEANFVIAGPDEGMLTSLKAEVSGSHLPDIRFEGPVAPENVMQRLCRSAIYVLPSVDEPFPMTVLEAMSAATPVIITTSCGLAEHVRNSRGGIVIEPTTTALVSAIKSLLESPGKAREIGNAARAYVRTHMSVDAVVTELEAMYSTANRDNKTSPRKGLRRYLD